MPTSTVIPARKGAAYVKAGQTGNVINTHSIQVVDNWAFSTANLKEFMSMEHTNLQSLQITPKVGN